MKPCFFLLVRQAGCAFVRFCQVEEALSESILGFTIRCVFFPSVYQSVCVCVSLFAVQATTTRHPLPAYECTSVGIFCTITQKEKKMESSIFGVLVLLGRRFLNNSYFSFYFVSLLFCHIPFKKIDFLLPVHIQRLLCACVSGTAKEWLLKPPQLRV